MIIEKHTDYSEALKHIMWPVDIDTKGRNVNTKILITEDKPGEVLIWLDAVEANKPIYADVAYGTILSIEIKTIDELLLKEDEIKSQATDFFEAQFK